MRKETEEKRMAIGWRYGEAHGASYNHRDNKYEGGISMASVCGIDCRSFACQNLKDRKVKKIYYLGAIIGTGGDDEYLFDFSYLQKIDYNHYKKLLPKYKEVKKQLIREKIRTKIYLAKKGYNIDKEGLKKLIKERNK